ncbi:MAG: bifunctional 4-hydroxy-2-oxoglutarate aldolase/2-dehydro-3-deoxy-phosphogluconate aldolase [Kiritimatiellae bacterium]|nr:bifunctional 4-hydroxy-2-oxoglutarate aldolase/2-dehydro-3-deoxy-phosphogluconate aldolase [Kiritimatiellia bacterium]
MSSSVLDSMAQAGIVPVIAIDSLDHALPLADALLAGGLNAVEITFRTKAAAEVIRKLSAERPQLITGAGTVLSPETLELAVSCGAKFAVAPGLNPRVVQAAKDSGLPFIPGVATPSDIERGLELGCRILKFFPAEALGGVSLLSAFAGPYKHTGVRFMPTGGVKTSNLADYLALPIVACVGGTWIAKATDMAEGKWAEITQRCRDAVSLVAQIRGGTK